MKPALAEAKKPDRLAEISLDRGSFTTASAELEIERQRAVSDLLADNRFCLSSTPSGGPWKLHLGIEDNRLIFQLSSLRAPLREEIALPLTPLARIIRDYGLVVDNFYKTAKAGQIARLETLDEGRRSLHDEGAEALIGQLSGKAEIDKATARRLFTLAYVLHMRLSSTIPV